MVQWLRGNLGSVGLALVLGLTVWTIVNREQNPIEESDLGSAVKVTVIGLEPGLLITNSPAETVLIRLRAPLATWEALSADQISVVADLTGLGEGVHQVNLTVRINAQAVLVSATPAVLRFELEKESQREIPIQTSLEGTLATGYSAGPPEIEPRTVTVVGPRTAVELISEVRASVPVDGLRESFKDALLLVALDADGNAITSVAIQPEVAQVFVPIAQDAGYRDIAVIAQTIGQPESGYFVASIRVIPDLITVRGDPEIIAAMQPFAETEPVSLTGLTESSVREVSLGLPAGVTPVEAQTIQMFITIQPLLGSRQLQLPVRAFGAGDGVIVKFSPTTVDVFLSGPLPILDALDGVDSVVVIVDVSGLGPGTYQLEPEVQIFRSEIALESFFPTKISTTIKAKTPE